VLAVGVPFYLLASTNFSQQTRDDGSSNLGKLLGFVVDQAFNPQPSGGIPATVGGEESARIEGIFLIVAGWLACVFVLSITFTSILTAMFSRAFDAQSSGAEFLVERMRANLLLESMMQPFELRQHAQARPRDRYWLLNKPIDVLPQGERLRREEKHTDKILKQPYFFHICPAPLESTLSSRNRNVAKKALSKQALAKPPAALVDVFQAPAGKDPPLFPKSELGVKKGGNEGWLGGSGGGVGGSEGGSP
jgi:hypothetical protein